MKKQTNSLPRENTIKNPRIARPVSSRVRNLGKADTFNRVICPNCEEDISYYVDKGRKQALEEEFEWLKICYKRFPHNFVEQRLEDIKSKINEIK